MGKKAIGFLGKPGLDFPPARGEAGWGRLSKGGRSERARAFPGLAWERGLGLSPAKGKLREGAGFK